MNVLVQGMENPESLMVFYVMFRGVDRFYDEYNRYPGEFEEESDIVKLKVSFFHNSIIHSPVIICILHACLLNFIYSILKHKAMQDPLYPLS